MVNVRDIVGATPDSRCVHKVTDVSFAHGGFVVVHRSCGQCGSPQGMELTEGQSNMRWPGDSVATIEDVKGKLGLVGDVLNIPADIVMALKDSADTLLGKPAQQS